MTVSKRTPAVTVGVVGPQGPPGPPGPEGPPHDLPLPQVATWSALPPATTDDIGRRIHVTSGLGWCVALCVADPNPRWKTAPESDTGWHDVTATYVNDPDYPINATRGMTLPAGDKSVWLRRIGNTVHFHIGPLTLIGDGSKPREAVIGPSLFNTGWWWRPPGASADARATAFATMSRYNYFPPEDATLYAGTSMTLPAIHSAGTFATDSLYSQLSWTSDEQWPTATP